MIQPQFPLKPRKTAPTIKYDDASHRYWIDGTEVPSVTTLLDLVDPKPALVWWGMRAGMAATIKLLQTGLITWPVLEEHVYEEVLTGKPVQSPKVMRGKGKRAKLKTVVEAEVLNAKLDTNNIKKRGAARGTAIHEAIEQIGTLDVIPDITKFPEDQQGYVQAIARWWIEQQPDFHRQEVIIGSRRFAYGGRFDLDATIDPWGRCLVDFKTAGDIYESYHEQLRLYEQGEYELNEWAAEPTHFDALLVVRVGADGQYAVENSGHVHPATAGAVATLAHHRRANAARKDAGETVPKGLPLP